MKSHRTSPVACTLALSLLGACSSGSKAAPTQDGGATDPSASATTATTDGGGASGTANEDPVSGLGEPVAIDSVSTLYALGPVWVTDALYFAEYKPNGVLIKIQPPLNVPEVFRAAPVSPGYELLGSTYDVITSTFVTCEVASGAGARGGKLVRTTQDGVATPISLTFAPGAAFDAPKNIIARKSDGTLYVSDPGYQVDPQSVITTNHLWQISPNGQVVETPVTGRPNGIAFTPDQTSVYVSFTDAPSTILRYPLADDGTLGKALPYITLEPGDATADGLAVDINGNVYVGVATGVDVFKADGTKWGHIGSRPVSDVAFGGSDRRTLYMTSTDGAAGAGILSIAAKIPGLTP